MLAAAGVPGFLAGSGYLRPKVQQLAAQDRPVLEVLVHNELAAMQPGDQGRDDGRFGHAEHVAVAVHLETAVDRHTDRGEAGIDEHVVNPAADAGEIDNQAGLARQAAHDEPNALDLRRVRGL